MVFIAAIVGCLLFAALFGWVLVRNISRQLGGEPGEAASLAQAVAEGDFSIPVNLRPGDAASLMAQLKEMQTRLSLVVSNVRQGSEGVANAFGIFEGQTYAQINLDGPEESRRWRQRDPHFAPQGGETLTQLRERVTATVNALVSQHVSEQIVLVAHGGVMDVLYRAATRQDLQAPRSWELGNAAINRLLWTPEGLTLVGWSDTRHLDDKEALDETTA